jgi:uncharacterized protein YbcI
MADPQRTLPHERDPADSSLGSKISNAVVRLTRDYTGRGPTAARTIINQNVVVTMLQDSLTKGERRLVEAGRAERVLEMRRDYQDAMRVDLVAKVEGLTGCKVDAMLSANHVDPDLASEIFVLDKAPRDGAGDPDAI